MHLFPGDTDAGGLVSYGPDAREMWARSADIVDKILRGKKPAHISIEAPTKFALVVNLQTAKALVLTIPETFLTRADGVIE
jgi:putative ABC transport system substrate-binding protein